MVQEKCMSVCCYRQSRMLAWLPAAQPQTYFVSPNENFMLFPSSGPLSILFPLPGALSAYLVYHSLHVN